MKAFQLAFYSGIIICNCILTSCSNNSAEAIAGKWRVESRFSEVVEFGKDGKIISTRGTNTQARTYKFVDSNHLKIEFNEPSFFVNCEIQIHGDLIDMTTISVGQTVSSSYPIKPVTSHLHRIKD